MSAFYKRPSVPRSRRARARSRFSELVGCPHRIRPDRSRCRCVGRRGGHLHELAPAAANQAACG